MNGPSTVGYQRPVHELSGYLKGPKGPKGFVRYVPRKDVPDGEVRAVSKDSLVGDLYSKINNPTPTLQTYKDSIPKMKEQMKPHDKKLTSLENSKSLLTKAPNMSTGQAVISETLRTQSESISINDNDGFGRYDEGALSKSAPDGSGSYLRRMKLDPTRSFWGSGGSSRSGSVTPNTPTSKHRSYLMNEGRKRRNAQKYVQSVQSNQSGPRQDL